jgi:hypothetical protein
LKIITPKFGECVGGCDEGDEPHSLGYQFSSFVPESSPDNKSDYGSEYYCRNIDERSGTDEHDSSLDSFEYAKFQKLDKSIEYLAQAS